MIMAFIIIASFRCHEKAILVGHIAKFGFRIPGIAGSLIICTHSFQFFTGEQGLEQTERVTGRNTVLIRKTLEISSIVHHKRAFDCFPIPENEIGIPSSFGRSIGKVDHPAVPHIRAGNIFTHILNDRLIEYGDFTTCPVRKHLQIIVHLSSSMSPIRRAFLATSVSMRIIDEMIHGSHRPVNRFCQFIPIILKQEETLQHIEVTPRIPVIHQSARLQVERHPPEMIFIHIGIEDADL